MFKTRNLLCTLMTVSTFSLSELHSQELLFDINGSNAGEGLGSALVALSDVNGNGSIDIAIGSSLSNETGNDAGKVQVIDGETETTIFSIFGFAPGQNLGASVARLDDLTGDTFPEILVGAPGGDGFAAIYNGISGSLIRIHNGSNVEKKGFCVSALGDIDGDGTEDYAVGSPAFNGLGKVDIYSGSNGSLVRTIDGTRTNGEFGFSLSKIEDVDGDGFNDIVIGEPSSSVSVVRGGSVYIYSPSSGQLLRQVDGNQYRGALGFSVLGLPDLNGDGLVEFAAGAPYADLVDADNGSVFVFNGNVSLPPLYNFAGTYVGTGNGEELGRSLTSLDFNGDGTLELAAGAPNGRCGPTTGEVWIFSLGTGCLLYQVASTSGDSDRFGLTIGGGVDLNSDGFDELFVGDVTSDESFGGGGRAWFFTGNDLFLNICPRNFSAGSLIDLSLAERPFRTPFIIVVFAINGSPFFKPVIASAFPGTGCFRLIDASTLGFPPSTSLTLRAYSLDNSGRAIQSNDEIIQSS